ncbi:MAG: carbohydrate binding domain-containing protein, partial [Oscillospiraceae bacterium]|nr:carbohydrate binding domain-containing protein [Oscillospiraceae bacterium]
MKKRLLAVFMVLAMLFGMIPVTAFAAEEPHNYVGNGSFEEAGALWNYPSQWPNAELITGDAEGAADGSNYVKLTCTGTQTQLGAVALALVPGATFRFSAQVKGTVEEGTLVVDLRHYGNGGAPLTASWGVYDLVVASADEWNTVSVDVVLPEEIGTNTTGGTEIRIGFKNGTGKGVVYVDDVRFYEVVEEPDEPVYGPIGENLITNGSFENLDADGKPMGVGANNGDKTFGGANGTHTIVSDTDKVYDGTKAAYIYDTAGQTLRLVMNAPAVEAGKSYQFSFWAKGNTESPWTAGNYYKLGAALDYQSDGMTLIDIPAEYAMELKDDEWHQLTYVFEAAETGSLAFYIGCGWAPWIAAVDGVALYEYGEIDPDAPVVDTTALEAAIAAAEALTEEDYTAETWSAMQTALTAAKAALESKVQDDIDAAATALNNAVAALEDAFEPVSVGLVNPDFESNPSELVVPGWEASGFGAWSEGNVCTTYSNNW